MIPERMGLLSREDVKIALDLSTNGDILYVGPLAIGWIYEKQLTLIGDHNKIAELKQFLNGGDE